MADPRNELTHLVFRSHYYANIKRMNRRTFVSSTYLLEENTATIPFYMLLPRFSPYTEKFNEKIDEMLASGIIERWHANEWSIERDEKLFFEEVGPQVLTIKNLKIGFFAFLITLALSSVVFVMELTFFLLKACVVNYLWAH